MRGLHNLQIAAARPEDWAMHDPMSQSPPCDSSHSFICRYQQQLRSARGKYRAPPPSSEQYSAEAALVTTKTFVALSRRLRSEAASCVECSVYPAHMCRLATQCTAVECHVVMSSRGLNICQWNKYHKEEKMSDVRRVFRGVKRTSIRC